MIISNGKGVMYFSRLCFLDLDLFAWQILIFEGMDKVYYYSRITKQCIENTKLDLDYQTFLHDILSPANIWNMSDDESDEEESISNDFTLYSENI